MLGHPVVGVIRDATSTPGPAVEAAQSLLEEGVHAIDGGEVDYEGVASTLDWDEHGDLRRGTSRCGASPRTDASRRWKRFCSSSRRCTRPACRSTEPG